VKLPKKEIGKLGAEDSANRDSTHKKEIDADWAETMNRGTWFPGRKKGGRIGKVGTVHGERAVGEPGRKESGASLGGRGGELEKDENGLDLIFQARGKVGYCAV